MNIGDNLNKLLDEAKKMQKRMGDAQEELKNLKVEGEAGTGAVKVQVTMNGRHEVINIKIPAALMDEESDPETLAEYLKGAFNSAVNKVEAASKKKISELTAGLNIPTDLLGEKE